MKFILPFILVLGLGATIVALESNGSGLFSKKARFNPSVKTIFFKLGSSTFPLKVQQYGSKKDIVFLSLHDDETTSVEATRDLLEKYGGMMIELENKQQRNIRFRLGSSFYTVDPNRIFSRKGITKSLMENGPTSRKAIEEIEKLAHRIIEFLPANPTCVIALHNNTPGMYSAASYTAGNRRAGDARKVYINKKTDSDDFFLTTDEKLYEPLAEAGFNTVLQDNRKCTEDGSLSVYCGKKNIRYVNLETEHDKSEIYYHMMKALIGVLDR